MNFVDSETYKNLMNAFNGETKAAGKYSLYSQKSREDGYEQIGNIFDETSHNEREHAEIWLKLLNGGEVPNTLENLKDASNGEYYEWTTMYKNYAEVARKEGYIDIANLFSEVANIEKHHDRRFKILASNIENNEVFCKKNETMWVCLNCGNIITGTCAPSVCPVCSYPQGFYELLCENY